MLYIIYPNALYMMVFMLSSNVMNETNFVKKIQDLFYPLNAFSRKYVAVDLINSPHNVFIYLYLVRKYSQPETDFSFLVGLNNIFCHV